eukprot:scaffold3942_cov123-Isochrysis_galbana.AAC.7
MNRHRLVDLPAVRHRQCVLCGVGIGTKAVPPVAHSRQPSASTARRINASSSTVHSRRSTALRGGGRRSGGGLPAAGTAHRCTIGTAATAGTGDSTHGWAEWGEDAVGPSRETSLTAHAIGASSPVCTGGQEPPWLSGKANSVAYGG